MTTEHTKAFFNANRALLNSRPLLDEDMYYSYEQSPKLTFFGKDRDADAGVTQFDEGGVSSPPVFFSDQKNVFAAHVAVDELLFFLQVQRGRGASKAHLPLSRQTSNQSLHPTRWNSLEPTCRPNVLHYST